MVSELSHVSNREISAMSTEVLESRLEELQEELLQLNAEKSMGGTPSSIGAFKATRRSIARIKTLSKQRGLKLEKERMTRWH